MCGQVHYHPLELKQHLKTSTESGEGITTLLTVILNVSLVKKINLSSSKGNGFLCLPSVIRDCLLFFVQFKQNHTLSLESIRYLYLL